MSLQQAEVLIPAGPVLPKYVGGEVLHVLGYKNIRHGLYKTTFSEDGREDTYLLTKNLHLIFANESGQVLAFSPPKAGFYTLNPAFAGFGVRANLWAEDFDSAHTFLLDILSGKGVQLDALFLKNRRRAATMQSFDPDSPIDLHAESFRQAAENWLEWLDRQKLTSS